jgi:hypothetical protein
MIGGEAWRQWYAFMKQVLLPAVTRSGDLCYWNDNEAGPVYGTACFTTILAMPYHYLPLYQR